MMIRQQQQHSSSLFGLLLFVVSALTLVQAFQVQQQQLPTTTSTSLFSTTPRPTGYEPKWKKKKTLAEEMGTRDPREVGLKGNINVIFKQGNETKTTIALAGQPLRDVASQAGQFIKYGCGKGECGTCECLVNGKWIRPCSTAVPADLAPGDDYIINLKEMKHKSTSSGKFYSVKSFLKGFWNNLLGMVGFVKYRKAADNNWKERHEFEDLVKQKALEKKRLREQEVKQLKP